MSRTDALYYFDKIPPMAQKSWMLFSLISPLFIMTLFLLIQLLLMILAMVSQVITLVSFLSLSLVQALHHQDRKEPFPSVLNRTPK